MSIYLADTLTLNDRRNTQDGYLVASARAARTGVQLYAGAEVDRPEMAVVRVYRPPEEVFSHDSLASYANRPITVGHPPNGVSAETWKTHAVGHVGDGIVPDGQFVRVPLMIADAAAIRGLEAGGTQMSAGYNCSLDWTAGTTADGQPWDAVQRRIRVNHVALVPQGRAGADCRLGDSVAPTAVDFIDHLPVGFLTRLNRVTGDVQSGEVFRIQGAVKAARAMADDIARGGVVPQAMAADAARYLLGLADRAGARAATLGGHNPPHHQTKDTSMNVNDSIQRLPHEFVSKVHFALADLGADSDVQRRSGLDGAQVLIHRLKNLGSGDGLSRLYADADTGSVAVVIAALETAIQDSALIGLDPHARRRSEQRDAWMHPADRPAQDRQAVTTDERQSAYEQMIEDQRNAWKR